MPRVRFEGLPAFQGSWAECFEYLSKAFQANEKGYDHPAEFFWSVKTSHDSLVAEHHPHMWECLCEDVGKFRCYVEAFGSSNG